MSLDYGQLRNKCYYDYQWAADKIFEHQKMIAAARQCSHQRKDLISLVREMIDDMPKGLDSFIYEERLKKIIDQTGRVKKGAI